MFHTYPSPPKNTNTLSYTSNITANATMLSTHTKPPDPDLIVHYYKIITSLLSSHVIYSYSTISNIIRDNILVSITYLTYYSDDVESVKLIFKVYQSLYITSVSSINTTVSSEVEKIRSELGVHILHILLELLVYSKLSSVLWLAYTDTVYILLSHTTPTLDIYYQQYITQQHNNTNNTGVIILTDPIYLTDARTWLLLFLQKLTTILPETTNIKFLPPTYHILLFTYIYPVSKLIGGDRVVTKRKFKLLFTQLIKYCHGSAGEEDVLSVILS